MEESKYIYLTKVPEYKNVYKVDIVAQMVHNLKFFIDISDYSDSKTFEQLVIKDLNEKFERLYESDSTKCFIGNYNDMIDVILKVRSTLKPVELEEDQLENIVYPSEIEKYRKNDMIKLLDIRDYIKINNKIPVTNKDTKHSKSWSFMHNLANSLHQLPISAINVFRYKLTKHIPKLHEYIDNRMVKYYMRQFAIDESSARAKWLKVTSEF